MKKKIIKRIRWTKVAAKILISYIMVIPVIMSFSPNENQVAAKVNGEKIYSEDIENIYIQLDGSYAKTAVLNDLIDEMVVVTKAKDMGIEITDRDLAAALEEYKETLPDIYEKGIEIYGKKDFIEGFEMQLIYNEIYDKIIKHTLQENENKLIDEFYCSMKLKNIIPEEIGKDEFLQEYQLEFFDYVFDGWLIAQREEAEIEIFNNRGN